MKNKTYPYTKIRFSSIVPAMLAVALAMIASTADGRDRDRFEYDPTPEKKAKSSSSSSSRSSSSSKSSVKTGVSRQSTATLKVGDVLQIFKGKGSALYLPAAKPTVAQVVVEKKFLSSPTYFVKGVSHGSVRGAIVPRSWLDKSGFKPKSNADLARIQQVLKTNSILVIVK